MQDADKAWDEVSALIYLVEKPEDDIADSLEEAVEEGTVIEEEGTQVFINGEERRHACEYIQTWRHRKRGPHS